MTEPAPHAATLPPASPNGVAPAPAPTAIPTATPASATPTSPTPTSPESAVPPVRGPKGSRIGTARTALIAGALVLIVVLVFIIENAHAVTITFFGAHLRISLAVALLLAAIAGALIMAAAGTARITQLRMTMRRNRRAPRDK
jgi:lipopolysaccharide assembly protein A